MSETNERKINSLKDFTAPTFKDDELVVYVHPYNFYSQKVCYDNRRIIILHPSVKLYSLIKFVVDTI